MRILFIHSGKEFFKELGSHYEPLIRHSLHLLPIHQYLRLRSIQDKQKYRAIEALPTGAIIGMALFDESFWFDSNHLQKPWAHGPYCYHIRDVIRLEKPMKCRGLPGIWSIDKHILRKIESMQSITTKMNEWKQMYTISKSDTLYALTVLQPFAESIIRKIKTIENRGSRLFLLSDNDGEFKGCRMCIMKELKEKNETPSRICYEKYGKRFVNMNVKIHSNIPRYTNNTDFRYHRSATLIHCQCKGKEVKSNQKSDKNTKNTKNGKKIRNKRRGTLKLKPLPDYNGMNKRRKPSRNRNSNRNVCKIKYGRYYDEEFTINGGNVAVFDENKTYNFRNKNKECYKQLIKMGYDTDLAGKASRKHEDIIDAIEYLNGLQIVKEAKDVTLGFTDKLNGNNMNSNNGVDRNKNRKRKREYIEVDEDEDEDGDGNTNKYRRLDDKYDEYEQILNSREYNEDEAIQDAIRASKSTHVEEAQWMEYCGNKENRLKEAKGVDNNRNKGLGSSFFNRNNLVGGIPRRRCS